MRSDDRSICRKSQYMQRHNNINDDRYSNSKRDSDNEFNIQRDSARVILTRTHLFASRDAPSAPLSDDWWPVWKDQCHLVHFDWPKRASDCGSFNKSMSFCHVMLWDLQLLYLICLSFPVLYLFSHLLCSGHDLSVSQQDRMDLRSTFRCYGHIVRFDSFICSRHLFRRIRWTTRTCGTFPWSWPVYLHEMGITLSHLWVFGRFRTFWDGRSCHVDAGLFVGTGQMETSTRRTSADLLCDDLSILSRSPGPLHRHDVSMDNGFDEYRIGTITSEFHERELDVDRIRNVADKFQSSSVISESLSFWFLPDVAIGWWHFDFASMPFRRVTEWTSSRAAHKSDLWSLPQIQSSHLVRRRRLLVLVMLVLPVERRRTELQCCTRGGCSDGHSSKYARILFRGYGHRRKNASQLRFSLLLISDLSVKSLTNRWYQPEETSFFSNKISHRLCLSGIFLLYSARSFSMTRFSFFYRILDTAWSRCFFLTTCTRQSSSIESYSMIACLMVCQNSNPSFCAYRKSNFALVTIKICKELFSIRFLRIEESALLLPSLSKSDFFCNGTSFTDGLVLLTLHWSHELNLSVFVLVQFSTHVFQSSEFQVTVRANPLQWHVKVFQGIAPSDWRGSDERLDTFTTRDDSSNDSPDSYLTQGMTVRVMSPYFALQSGSLLALLEQCLQKSLVCTTWISPDLSMDQLWLGFLSSELPLLEFPASLMIQSAHSIDLSCQIDTRILHPLIWNRTSDLTRERLRK